MARLFLSHASADSAAAIALGIWLGEIGIDDVFLDIDPDRGLVAGERWQEALKAAADRCEAVLFLVSRAWLASRWCLAEFLLAKTLHKRIFGLLIERVPTDQLPVEMTGEWQLCDLSGANRPRGFEVAARGGTVRVLFSEPGLDLLRRGLLRAGLAGRSFPWPPQNEPSRAPYRGLRALDAQDAAIFFGRDAEIVRGMDRIRGLVEGGLGAFLVILGASGAGKSSFLRAGLLPRLARDDVHFLPLPVVRPEAAVLTGAAGLAAAVTAAFAQLRAPRNLGDVRHALLQDGGGLAALLGELLELARRRLAVSQSGRADPVLILPLDQAEELFAAEGAVEAERFLALVAPLLAPDVGGAHRLLLIATIRSDRYEELQAAPAIAGIRQEPFSLPPMPPAEFKGVIEGPALRATAAGRSLTIAPELTARLIAEARGADALPLLGFTLEQLYQDFGAGGALTCAQYDALGGVRGVLEAAVGAALSAPDRAPAIPADRGEQMALLRSAFIPWLARIDPASRAPRRRVAALAEIPVEARAMVARLAEVRLLATDHRNGCDVVEVAHESLLRNWGALAGWLDEDAADLAILDSVERAASDWESNDRADAWLDHRGARLAEAQRVLARCDFSWQLEGLGLRYLAACQVREVAAQAERRAAARRLLRRTQVGLVAALVLMVAAGVGAWFGFSGKRSAMSARNALQAQFEIAEERRAQNLSLALKSESNPKIVEAVALSVIASRHGYESHHAIQPELLARLLVSANGNAQRLVLGHPDMVRSAQFSTDGRSIVTACHDKTARIWNANNGALLKVFVGHQAGVESAAYSPDGRRIVTGSADNTARVWDATSGKLLVPLVGHDDVVYDVAFSPDGRRIVTASLDKTARVWDAATGALLSTLRGHTAIVTSAAFSPDGLRIVTASLDGTARVWNTASSALLVTLRGHEGAVESAAFSPDGQHIVTSSDDKTARIWDSSNGAQLRTISGHTARLYNAAFSPDGRAIVTASYDKTARVWNSVSGALVTVFFGHDAPVATATFSPDGRRVITASLDQTVRVWDASSGSQLAILTGHGTTVDSAAFSPDARRIVTASEDKTVRVWNAGSGAQLVAATGHEAGVYSAAFSADGRTILTGGEDKTARLWNATTGAQLAILTGHKDTIASVAFSHDGRRIVTASHDKTARVWDADSGKMLGILSGHDDQLFSASFSQDGRRIVTASADRTARLWDAVTFAVLKVFRGHEDAVESAAFSPDGRYIATASDDKTARVWDAGSGAQLSILSGHEGTVESVAFSPVGARIVTASDDKTARVWDAASGTPLAVLAGHEGAVVGVAFSPDGRRIVTASADTTARIWDAPDYLGPNDVDFIRAISSRAVDSALRAQYALAAPAQPVDPMRSPACDRDESVPAATSNLQSLAAWAGGARSGDGSCNQRLAEYYGDSQPASRDLARAFFHHALAARLLEEQGQDDAAQHERYRREAFAWLLPRQRVEQLMDAADDWKPGQAFPQ